MVAIDKRILVVDDEEIVRESCELALTDAGYTVRTVATGKAAIEACRAERFDVMLADLKMPDMDGIEVARVVAREFPDVRVVIITGYPSRETAEQASKLGIFDYLEKPLHPDRLSEATAAVLACPPRPRPTEMPLAEPETAPAPEIRPVVDEPQPVIKGIAAEVPAEWVSPQPEELPSTVTPAARGGLLKGLALLAAAPFIGLAYVVLFPLIGFVALLAALGWGSAERLGLTRK